MFSKRHVQMFTLLIMQPLFTQIQKTQDINTVLEVSSCYETSTKKRFLLLKSSWKHSAFMSLNGGEVCFIYPWNDFVSLFNYLRIF